jgi:hypothetical protein
MSELDATTEILLRKYALLRQEIWLHIGFFKGHVTKFQLAGTAILAAGAYVLSHVELLPNRENWWVWWFAVTLFPVMCNYLAFDIIESQYAIILIGERLATIEEEINRSVGRRLLIWETMVSPTFWQGIRPMKGVINPDWFLSVFGGMIALSDAVVIPTLLYRILWNVGANGVWRRAALILGVMLAVGGLAITLVCAWRVLLRMRGKPRTLFRQMLAKEID